MDKVNLTSVENFMSINNLTEREMAVKMGISHSYLFRVLRGNRKAGGKFISGLIIAGMKPEQIFLPSSFPKGKSDIKPTGTDCK